MEDQEKPFKYLIVSQSYIRLCEFRTPRSSPETSVGHITSFAMLSCSFVKWGTKRPSGVPATKLLGSSSDGMNATGEGDIRNFYDHIKSYQDNFLHERLDYLDRIVAMSTFGSIPQDYGFEFNPLWQPTDKEVAEVQNIQAQRDMAYLNAGVMTPQNIAEELLHRETYQSLTPDDVEELGDMGVSSSMFNDPDFDLGGDDGADNNA